MKRNFLSVREFLEVTFPELTDKITGGHFPTPPLVNILLQLMTIIQFLTLAFIIFGNNLWTNVLMFRRVPSWYLKIKEHGFQFGILVFFVLPNVLNSYIVTGAFEIFVDGELVYSKIGTGKFPTAGNLVLAFTKLGLSEQ
jgi:thioredoxin reductase-like selenoprotein T